MGGGDRICGRRLTRRRFLAASGATAATVGVAALTMGAQCDPALIRKLQQGKNPSPPHHLVFVWQFSSDGSPGQIASNLAANHLALTLKTHDGTDWMATYDNHPSAVTGPAQVQVLARFFESNNVPFHAWAVPKGVDPVREAQMAADVLAAGARSLTLDLEGSSGFWVGSPADAVRYCDELRRRNPFGRVDITIDPRPWRINLAPMSQFVPYIDGIWPQLYWDTFDNPPNDYAYAISGYTPGPDGITPEFLLDVTSNVLAQYNRAIIPVGQGAAADPTTWPRFLRHAWDLGMGMVSVWRYAVTPYSVLVYLGNNPAGEPPQIPPPTPTGTPTAAPTGTQTAIPTGTPTPPVSPTRTATGTPSPTSTATFTPVPPATSSPVTVTPTP